MCLNLKFKNICVKEYGSCKTALGFFALPKPVCDELVAIINISKNKVRFVTNNICSNGKKRNKVSCKAIKRRNLSLICIILESPHSSEYDGNAPIGPAMSHTGRNISDHIEDVLNDAIQKNIIKFCDGEYSVLLMEAVSYQCSNGNDLSNENNKNKRNRVFEALWEKGGKRNFVKRIKKYNPVLIINSCTGGLQNKDDVEFLNGMVNASLSSLNYSTQKVNTCHPSSSWFWKKGIVK